MIAPKIRLFIIPNAMFFREMSTDLPRIDRVILVP